MVNPLVGQSLRATGVVTNPTASGANPRRFKVSDIWVEVLGAGNADVSFGHTGEVWVEIAAGAPYDKTRSFPAAGTYTVTPKVQLLDGTVIVGTSTQLTVAGATTTRTNHDDGSVWDVTTFTDGRAPVTTMIEGPVTSLSFTGGGVS